MMRATRTRTAGRRSRPIKHAAKRRMAKLSKPVRPVRVAVAPPEPVLYKLCRPGSGGDRKSTRLNSSHLVISYAVFCLKKKKKKNTHNNNTLMTIEYTI